MRHANSEKTTTNQKKFKLYVEKKKEKEGDRE